jgi:predicted NBD/HSP70 family sugar kinase
MRSVISVDLGGTWMRAARVAPDGACGKMVRLPTGRQRPGAAIVADLLGLIRGSGDRRGTAAPAGVALGIPTTLTVKGDLAPSDNLPTLTGFPLGRHLERKLQLPVALFNDANCFTMGEWWLGVGEGTRNFLGVTLGTGLGMGLVLDGRLHQGSHGCAGEIWKAPWEGGRLEQRVCGPALEAAYAAAAGRRLGGAAIAARAERGDACAFECFGGLGAALGRALAFAINLVDPEAVALGGALGAVFKYYRKPLLAALQAGTVAGKSVRVGPGKLGERAALLGAAKLYWDNQKSAGTKCHE